MPVVYLDSEAADMVQASCAMMEAALKARVKRADPDNHISNSLILQANKLETFRRMLDAPEPPKWSTLAEPLQVKAERVMKSMMSATKPEDLDLLWDTLRAICLAAHIS